MSRSPGAEQDPSGAQRVRGRFARLSDALARRSQLPPPLFDLRDRLAAAFTQGELSELAYAVDIDAEDIADDRLSVYALGLARAAWCRGKMAALLQAAAAGRPLADWTAPVLPDPPAEGCEDDPLPLFSVFSDWRQVAMFMLIPLAAAAIVAAGSWLAGRPDTMTADFNVAVAAVNATSLSQNSDYDPQQVGQLVQDQVVDIVERQLRALAQESGSGSTTSVSGTRMPVVDDDTQAEALAQKVNAQLVIYGDVELGAGGRIVFRPRFFVAIDDIRVDVGEMQRDVSIDAPFTFTIDELMATETPTGRTARAATLLTNFVRALVMLADDDLKQARRYIDAAMTQTEQYAEVYGPFAGREVIYLFASQIARLQAAEAEAARREALLGDAQHFVTKSLAINPIYARGHVAQANIYYDSQNLFQAQAEYEMAAALAASPDDLVALKAAQGLGNVHLARLQTIHRPIGAACVDEAGRRAAAGLAYYAVVRDAFDDTRQPDTPLRSLTAGALVSSGKIHHLCGEPAAAAADYCAALALEPGAELVESIGRLLAELPDQEGTSCVD